MTVVEAMETMAAAAAPEGRRGRTQAALLQQLRNGRSLSESMGQVPGFPPLLIASVAASEHSSTIVESLDEYLKYDAMLERLRRQVVSAAIYPAIVAALGLTVVVFLLTFVVPRFTRMYSELPAASVGVAAKLVVSMSRLLSEQYMAVLIVGATLVGITLFAWRRGQLSKLVAAAISHLPWLRVQLDSFQLTQFYHALGLMIRGGYPLSEALSVCARMARSDDFRARLERAREQIGRGLPLGSVFAAGRLADVVTERLLGVGERTGEFEVVLQTIAERHGTRFSTMVEQATKVAEPLLLLAVAALVGGVVVVMYMPIFDIAGQMGMRR